MLVFWPKIRNGISQRNQTTWANTDTMLGPSVCSRWKLNREIAIDELGGALKTLLEYMDEASNSDDVAAEEIQELKGLTSGQPIDHNRGPVDGDSLKLLVYGINKCLKRKLKLRK